LNTVCLFGFGNVPGLNVHSFIPGKKVGLNVILAPNSKKDLRAKNKKNCPPQNGRRKSAPAGNRKMMTLQGLRPEEFDEFFWKESSLMR